MVDLAAKSAGAGIFPLSIGKLTATETELGPLTSVMPFKGQSAALAAAFEAAHGLAWPAPNAATSAGGARAIWFGVNQVLLTGVAADISLAALAGLTDQSDAWCAVTLDGPGAEDVLARLCPVDLRASAFGEGRTARTLVAHMNGSVTRIGAQAFLILVFRSMAATLAHDLSEAMETVTARG